MTRWRPTGPIVMVDADGGPFAAQRLFTEADLLSELPIHSPPPTPTPSRYDGIGGEIPNGTIRLAVPGQPRRVALPSDAWWGSAWVEWFARGGQVWADGVWKDMR